METNSKKQTQATTDKKDETKKQGEKKTTTNTKDTKADPKTDVKTDVKIEIKTDTTTQSKSSNKNANNSTEPKDQEKDKNPTKAQNSNESLTTENIDEIKEIVKKVFTDFDIDKSGYIEIGELKKVGQELGVPITDNDINEILKDCDKNADRKISFDEFWKWWESGTNKKLGSLVVLKLKALKMLGKSGQKIKRFSNLLEAEFTGDTYDRHQITLTAGTPPYGVEFNVEASFGKCSEAKKSEFFKFPKDQAENKLPAGIIIRFKTKNKDDIESEEPNDPAYMQQLKEGFKKSIDSLLRQYEFLQGIMLAINIDYNVDGNDIVVIITPNPSAGLDINSFNFLPPQFTKTDFKVAFDFGLKNDLYTMHQNCMTDQVQHMIPGGKKGAPKKNKKLLLELIEGFYINFFAEVNSGLLKHMKKKILEELKNQADLPIKEYLKIMILGSKFTLKLQEFDQELITKIITKIGAGATFNNTPSFKDILVLLQKLGIFKEIKSEFLDFIKSNLLAHISICVFIPKLAVIVKFHTKGIKEAWEFICGSSS